MTRQEFARQMRQKLSQDLTADGIHHDDWPDAEIPVTDVFALIDEVERDYDKEAAEWGQEIDHRVDSARADQPNSYNQ